MFKNLLYSQVTFLLFVLCIGTSNICMAQGGSSNEITLIVSGEGQSKEEATKFALRSAIEQAYGTFVSSSTTILNDEIIQDEIISVSNGNISNYVYLVDSRVGEKYYVTIQATVSIGNLVQFVKSKGGQTELAGEAFAMSVKLKREQRENLQKLKDDIEKGDIYNMFKRTLRTTFLFNYEIKIGEPIDHENNNIVEVPFIVLGRSNGTIEKLDSMRRQLLDKVEELDPKLNSNSALKYYKYKYESDPLGGDNRLTTLGGPDPFKFGRPLERLFNGDNKYTKLCFKFIIKDDLREYDCYLTDGRFDHTGSICFFKTHSAEHLYETVSNVDNFIKRVKEFSYTDAYINYFDRWFEVHHEAVNRNGYHPNFSSGKAVDFYHSSPKKLFYNLLNSTDVNYYDCNFIILGTLNYTLEELSHISNIQIIPIVYNE